MSDCRQKTKTPSAKIRKASEEKAGKKLLQRVRIGKVLGSFLVQVSNQLLRGGRNANRTFEDDVFSVNFFAVDLFVGVVVGADGGPGQGNSGKQTASARVGENFGAHGDVRGSFSVAALGAGGGGGVSAEFYFAGKNGVSATGIHDQQYEISSLAAKLKADAGAFQSHHGGSAPGPGEMFAGAAGHGATAVAAADHKSRLENRGINNDAFGLVDQVLRNVIRNIHNFLDDGAAIFQPVGFFFIFRAERQTQNGQGKKHGHKLLHKKSPLRGCARSSKKAAKGGQRNSSPEASRRAAGVGAPLRRECSVMYGIYLPGREFSSKGNGVHEKSAGKAKLD